MNKDINKDSFCSDLERLCKMYAILRESPEQFILHDANIYELSLNPNIMADYVVQKEDMFCATQHGEEKQQINPSSANRFAFVKHEMTFNSTQVCTFGAKLCGFVCKDRAQHSIEHHYKADIASCIGSIIIMR